MSKDDFNIEMPSVENRPRAFRHPHIPGMWCYRQTDAAYEHLLVGRLGFAEGGACVCAIADIVDVKPDKVLAFLEDAGYVTPESGIDVQGVGAALKHFGGSFVPTGAHGLQTKINARSLEALQKHVESGAPAIIFLSESERSGSVVAAAGYDATRAEMLLFDPRGAELDGWYSWEQVAGALKAFVLATMPAEDHYSPRYIFKNVFGIDIAGHEQRWPDIDFAALKEINPECLGWIHLGGTPLTYPIVEDHLDSTYYQQHNFSGEASVHGAVSLSFANGGSFDARNLLFSAHRMKDYSMFKMLTVYDRPSFAQEHPFIDLLLGERLYKARVFSAYHFPKRRDEAFRVDFDDDAEFEQWFRKRIDLSMHPIAAPSHVGQVATFRTCYGLDNDKTFVVHALLEEA